MARDRSQHRDDPQDVEKARVRLANAILSIADEDSRDVEVTQACGIATDGVGLISVALSENPNDTA